MKLTYNQVVDELAELDVIEQYDMIFGLLLNSECTDAEHAILLENWKAYRDYVVDELANEQ